MVDLLGCGWLLSSVVGGHNTNARIKKPTFDLFRQIIVLVSLHVLLDTLTATFCFYVCFIAFIELRDVKFKI